MENYKHLKSEIYYSDLYDRMTVEEGRRFVERGVSEEYHTDKDKMAKINKIKKDFIVNVVTPTALYFMKGERYLEKEKTIREWMERDRHKDEMLNSAKPPEDVLCLICGSPVTPTFRDLHDYGTDNKKARVLFMYDCPNGCLPHRAFFDDGEEYRPKRHMCPKCKIELKSTTYKNKSKLIITDFCKKCGYKDVIDLSTKKEKIDKNFLKDRDRFCLTKEEGKKYSDSRISIEQLKNLVDKIEEKDKNKELYAEVAKIKKLTAVGLEKLVTPVLEKANYIHLQLGVPEINKDVIIPFTVQDSKTGRENMASQYDLKRLLKKTLQDTNWRVMSDGVSCRLGILSGRLRGYENEEDLLKLIIK